MGASQRWEKGEGVRALGSALGAAIVVVNRVVSYSMPASRRRHYRFAVDACRLLRTCANGSAREHSF